MNYYSRSPEEVRDLSEARQDSTFKKKRMAVIILFADLLLVSLILIYFTQNVLDKSSQVNDQNNKKDKVKKTFSASEYKIHSHCETTKGCQVKIIASQNASFSQIRWLVLENNILSENHSFSKKLDHGKTILKEEFGFPLKDTEKVFISLSKAYDAEEKKNQQAAAIKTNSTDGILKFQIYP